MWYRISRQVLMPDKTYSCESVCLTYLAPRKRERIPISRKLNVDRLPRSDSPSIMEAIRLHRSQLNLIRSFHSTQRLLYTKIFTHDNFYTQKLLHTDTFTQSNFYTQELLHIHTFTHRNFYRRIHTDTFTRTVFLQTNVSNYLCCSRSKIVSSKNVVPKPWKSQLTYFFGYGKGCDQHLLQVQRYFLRSNLISCKGLLPAHQKRNFGFFFIIKPDCAPKDCL
jgi:hypothetical protein